VIKEAHLVGRDWHVAFHPFAVGVDVCIVGARKGLEDFTVGCEGVV